ncbi:DUF1800 domain-containing protein [Granulicella sp. dw_53]|uniref:DUF1800 domain-containing protein n=1 Tax=Granulicella sp. dw_53 TaxID=2719792 RepID=UPI001BD4F235|nr:DUF1800 domain-containing protein [Granulicella sp. dw_53]
MKPRKSFAATWKAPIRTGAAGLLCILLVEQPLLAAGIAAKNSPKAPIATPQIQGEQRVLHALNRLTFGPRPGELEAAQTMGLEKWFERQLNPASIDDSALDRRLDQFPAMRMQQADLMDRYPSPQLLRQMIRTNAPLPSDPVKHAIYADQIAFYKVAQAKKAATAASQTPDSVATPKRTQSADPMSMEAAKMASEDQEDKQKADNGDPATAATATHRDQFYPESDTARILNLPPDQRVNRILAMQPQELINFHNSLSRKELATLVQGLDPTQKETLGSLQGSPRLIGAELSESRLLRAIYSDRQLEAVMTDFWLNHFNVYLKKNQNEPYFLPSYERDVIRPNALGNFEDLLVATAKSPAMLMYLDNWQSIGPSSAAAKNGQRFAFLARNTQVKQALKDRGLNENYARELMELHTLGVQCEVSEDHPATALSPACGHGYTQQDVTQVAKILSGWTIDRPLRGGEYRFELRRHEPGSKQVLGAVIPESGEREGLEVLHRLAISPATAQFISNKLAIRFVSDTPPQTLVDRMAKAFEASHGDIKTVLRTMFQSPEFWAPDVYRDKVKTPLEFVASAVRASNADVGNALPLVRSLDRLGMPLYGMQTPNGYSWLAEPWVSSSALVNRMNFTLLLCGNRLPGTRTDWPQYLGAPNESLRKSVAFNTPDADASAAIREKKLEQLLIGQPVSERTRETVLRQFKDTATQLQAARDFPLKPVDPQMLANSPPDPSMATQQDAPEAAPSDHLGHIDRQSAIMAGLLLGSPEFQRR